MSNITVSIASRAKDELPFLNEQTKQAFEIVNFTLLSCIIAVFGIVANGINLTVFIKQGLDNTVNIALTGLSISDLCSLLTVLLIDVWQNPLLIQCNVPIKPTEVQHLTAGLPHGCFTRITSWITAYITAERCLCVSFPLQVKHILTPRKTTLIICCIYTVVIASLLPEYISLYLDWRWDLESNRTMLGLLHRYGQLHLDGVTFLLYSLYMFASFLTVTFLTLTLTIKLKMIGLWRQSVAALCDQRISHREKKAIKMTLTLASLLILTFCPTIVVTTCGFLIPGFGVTGQWSSLFFLCWSFVLVFDAANASVNIFFYYRQSSKFRNTFHEMFTSSPTNEQSLKPLRNKFCELLFCR